MGKASSKHKVDKPELVLELFKKAGHTHHIKPGHVLIEQGKESESLFLVVSGELVLKRGTKELARRGVGQLLGEMSFLLGSKPGVTVVAEAPVTIVELQQSKVLRVLQHDPQLAAQVFRSLAVTLSERVKERSAALRTEVNEAHQPAHTHVAELTSPLEASPRELAKKFGLAASTALIIHCDCSVFFEQNSQRDQDEHPATLYLFETHLCLDVGAFGLTTQRSVAMTDILALLKAGGGVAGPAAPAAKGGRRKSVTGRAPSVVEVQCKGVSVTLTLPSRLYEAVCHEIEAARVAAAEQTTLSAEASKGHALKDAGGNFKMDAQVASLMGQHANEARREVPQKVTAEDWALFLEGAQRRRYVHGEVVLREGDETQALYQVARGSLRVELAIKGRPQALVVGRREQGDLFGERTLLLGGRASATIVCDSDEAVVLWLPASYLHELFASHPELPGKFYCFLATFLAGRLQQMTADDDVPELVLPEGSKAPTDMATLLANPAYLSIVHKFISKLPESKTHSRNQLDFYSELLAFKSEPDGKTLLEHAKTLHGRYLGSRPDRPLGCVSQKMQAAMEEAVKGLRCLS